jgi:hypothetical protein
MGGGSNHEILEGGEAGDALFAAEILRRELVTSDRKLKESREGSK